MNNPTKINNEHIARASSKNIPVSTKHSIELSRMLRYKTTTEAKKILGGVSALKTAVPFRRFKHNVGHKAGMASGRFPQKAAREFLKLVESVEANAHFKGLNTTNLKIVKILANRAPIPFTGGRFRRGTKRTHLEIEVKEKAAAKAAKKENEKSKKEIKEAPMPMKTVQAPKTPVAKKQEKGEKQP